MYIVYGYIYVLTKENNYCDFVLASLEDETLPKGGVPLSA